MHPIAQQLSKRKWTLKTIPCLFPWHSAQGEYHTRTRHTNTLDMGSGTSLIVLLLALNARAKRTAHHEMLQESVSRRRNHIAPMNAPLAPTTHAAGGNTKVDGDAPPALPGIRGDGKLHCLLSNPFSSLVPLVVTPHHQGRDFF